MKWTLIRILWFVSCLNLGTPDMKCLPCLSAKSLAIFLAPYLTAELKPKAGQTIGYGLLPLPGSGEVRREMLRDLVPLSPQEHSLISTGGQLNLFLRWM